MNNTPKQGITGDITNNSGWVTINEGSNVLDDRVFVRQAAIAAMKGLLIGFPDSDCGMNGYCHDAVVYAKELLSAIKEHEQKGI